MENQNQSQFGFNGDPKHNEQNQSRRVGDANINHDLKSNNPGKQVNSETTPDKGGDQDPPKTAEQIAAEQKAEEAKRADPATLYNTAMEQFNPNETRYPQLAEHTIFRDSDFEEYGML